jgi:hypothetical protein
MQTRFFAVAAIAVLLLNVVGFSLGDTPRTRVLSPQASRLVSMLPASDAVAVFDTKRFLDDAMPRLLSANQPMLNEITGKMSQMERKTGIDFRKFDQVVVGVTIKSGKETKGFDCEPVAIAGGDINSGALIAIAKLHSKGKYREEKLGDKTLYVFTMPVTVKKTSPANTKRSRIARAIAAAKGHVSEIAVAALDTKTLAIGCPERVRETIEAKSHVGTDLTDLLATRQTAVMSFAAKTPAGMSRLLSLDNDDLGATINSIQYMSGSLDVAAVGTSLQMMARTAKPDQAVTLKETLEGLQMLGKAVLGNSKNPDQQIYGRMVRNAKFAVNGSDVRLDLLVPQADIDLLVAKVK